MKATVKAQVTKVSLESEYGKKSNGLTDYDNKIIYYESEISTLENSSGVRGHFILREKLEIGSIHEIIVDTEQSQQVVEIEGIGASRLKAE